VLFLKEYKNKPNLIADRLVWSALVSPGVVEQKDGLLQTTIRFRGHDLESATLNQQVANAGRLNNALKRLGGGWSIFVEAQRNVHKEYEVSDHGHPLTRLLDYQRGRSFKKGDHFISEYFCTFVFAPPTKRKKGALAFLFSSSKVDDVEKSRSEGLEQFEKEVESIISLFRGVFHDVHRLDDSETLTYLRSTIGTERHPMVAPETPVFLDGLLPTQNIEVGLELNIGKNHLRTMTIRSFPNQTFPGMLDSLNRLGFPYRWVSRFIFYDKSEALSEMKKYQRRWYSQRQGLMSLGSELLGGGASALQNNDAINKATDVDAAIQVVADDYVAMGLLTTTVTVWGEDEEEVAYRFSTVKAVIESRGFAVIEETFGALTAWLSSHPGNVYAGVRRPMLHTLNLSHLLPTSSIWPGPSEHTHLDGPPHILTSSGSTPFGLCTNVNDVGHTLILGPTGAGKSTLLALLELQFLKYENAQVFIFDKGGSAKAATYGVEGEFYKLSTEKGGLVFQPLRDVDSDVERTWALEWISDIVVSANVELTPDRQELIWSALVAVADHEQHQRSLSTFSVLVQDFDIRMALQPFIDDGPYAALFDGSDTNVRLATWTTFEMEELMQTKGAVAPTLSYLFHRLEKSFNGRPTLLVLDEAWMFLDNPQFSEKIREWLKVLRKKRVYVIFATQSIADAVSASIASAILENCLTRIYLPNNRALEPTLKQYYEVLGLNDRQIQILASATPKRQYYYQSPLGDRLFDLSLSSLELAFCGASTPDDLRELDRIRRQSGVSGFAPAWLRKHGFHEDSDLLMDVMGHSLEQTVRHDPFPVILKGELK